MSSLIFVKLKFKNFQSYGNEETVIDFNTQALTLIIGGNGDGKSTIVDALNFASFGRPYRKIKIGDLVNRINKKNLLTDLEVIRNNQTWRIVRGLAPQKLEIYKGDELLPKQDIRDMQEFIEKNILGFDEKIFRQIVTLGSGYYVPFLKLPLAQKREVIEQLFDLDVFSKMKVIVKERLSKQDTKLYELGNERKLTDNSISIIKDELDRAGRQNEQIKKAVEEKKKTFELQIESKQKSISYLKESVDQIRFRIEELKPKENVDEINKKIQEAIASKDNIEEAILAKKQIAISTLQKELNRLTEQKEKYNFEISNIQKKIYELKSEYQEDTIHINNELTKKVQEVEKRISIVNNDFDKNKKKLDFYSNNTICPTCQSELSGEKIKAIVEKLHKDNEDKEKEIQNHNETIIGFKEIGEETIRNKRNKFDERTEQLQKEKRVLEDEVSKNVLSIEELKKQISEIEENEFKKEIENQTKVILDFINQQKAILSEINNVNQKIKFQEEEITSKERDIAVHANSIELLVKQIEELKHTQFIDTKTIEEKLTEQRTKLSDTLKAEKKEKIILEYLKTIESLTSDSGIKTQIIKHYLPILQLKVNEYLALFQAEYSIALTEEFDVQIKLRQTETIDYDNFSGGEKIRIDLALMFSFVSFLKMKTGAMCSLLFFDEILDSSLDMNGISALVQILKIFSDNGFSVFVVSHRKENQSEDFSRVLEVKKNIFSEIKEM